MGYGKMEVETRTYVMGLLESCRKRENEITLLRYELNHFSGATSSEMIDAMAFPHSDYAMPYGSGGVSDKTLYIALNYQERLEGINSASRGEIAGRLVALEREQNRLFYYVKMLGKRPEQVIRGLYLLGKSQRALAVEIGVVPRTVRRIRDEAIEQLIAMYSLAETAYEDIPG